MASGIHGKLAALLAGYKRSFCASGMHTTTQYFTSSEVEKFPR